MSVARAQHAAIVLDYSPYNGKVLVTGGLTTTDTICGTPLYNPDTKAWEESGRPFQNCNEPWVALPLPNKRPLATNGTVSRIFGENNVVSFGWPPSGSLQTPRTEFSVGLLNSGAFLAVGGRSVGGDSLKTTEIYQPDAGVWVPGPDLPGTRAWHTQTTLLSGKVLVAGGAAFPFGQTIAEAHVYDPATGQWTRTGDLKTARGLHSAILLDSGKVLVVGGCSGGNPETTINYASAEIFDPATGQWSVADPPHFAWVGATATKLSSDRVLMVLGTASEVYDGIAGRWTYHGDSLTYSRSGHSATRLLSGRVLVAGGTSVLTAEEYNSLLVRPESLTVPPRNGPVSFIVDGGTGPYTLVAETAGSGGSIVGGSYSVGNTGNTRDVLAVLDSAGRSVRAVITVGSGVSIAPDGGTAPPRGTLPLSASGGSGDGYVWSFAANRSDAGFSNGSVYTAGPIGNVVDVVEVTDRLGNDARVEISVGPSVSVSPSQVSLPPRSTQVFSASGGSGTGYTWAFISNASGGTLNSSTGVYTAGSASGATDVVGVIDSLGNSGSATINVGGSSSQDSGGCATSSASGGPALAWLAALVIFLLRRKH
jgi:uncharacterized protein (TIGR03382 family)